MHGVVIMHARSKLLNSLITEGGRIVIKNHEGGIFVKTIVLGGRLVNCRIIIDLTPVHLGILALYMAFLYVHHETLLFLETASASL
jgi:hypothetical protein